jgi:hypothetical protein
LVPKLPRGILVYVIVSIKFDKEKTVLWWAELLKFP